MEKRKLVMTIIEYIELGEAAAKRKHYKHAYEYATRAINLLTLLIKSIL